MIKDFYTPNEFSGSDSERIKAAIYEAKRTGADKVVIPKYNKEANSFKWIIDKTILLPSDITIVLDNCFMIMADDTYCQMFATENLFDENGSDSLHEQQNINIYGKGNARICGGKENKLNEFTSERDENPHITSNVLIENIYYSAKPDCCKAAVCAASNAELINVKVKNIRAEDDVLREELFNMKEKTLF